MNLDHTIHCGRSLICRYQLEHAASLHRQRLEHALTLHVVQQQLQAGLLLHAGDLRSLKVMRTYNHGEAM